MGLTGIHNLKFQSDQQDGAVILCLWTQYLNKCSNTMRRSKRSQKKTCRWGKNTTHQTLPEFGDTKCEDKGLELRRNRPHYNSSSYFELFYHNLTNLQYLKSTWGLLQLYKKCRFIVKKKKNIANLQTQTCRTELYVN